MCAGLACWQVLQRPTALFRAKGQDSLAELLNCRYSLGETLSDRKKAQSPTFLFASIGCLSSTYHCEALHASMQPMLAGKANSDLKLSSAPVWIDCDAGSDDALGIAPLPAPPEEQLYKFIPKTQYASAGILLAARSNIVGISSVRGNTVQRDTPCSCRPLYHPCKMIFTSLLGCRASIQKCPQDINPVLQVLYMHFSSVKLCMAPALICMLQAGGTSFHRR